MKEIEIKSMSVSDASYIDNVTGELVSRVRVTFDAPVPQKRKQADGSYAEVEGNSIEMKASALRAKLYAASPLIADAKRASGKSLDLEMINSMLEAATVIKVQATKVEAGKEYEGVIFEHEGFGYKFVIQFTDDDVALAAKAKAARINKARAFLGI